MLRLKNKIKTLEQRLNLFKVNKTKTKKVNEMLK